MNQLNCCLRQIRTVQDDIWLLMSLRVEINRQKYLAGVQMKEIGVQDVVKMAFSEMLTVVKSTKRRSD
jgi:hypothetical protein